MPAPSIFQVIIKTHNLVYVLKSNLKTPELMVIAAIWVGRRVVDCHELIPD